MPKAKRGESANTEDNLLDAAKHAKQQVRLCCKAIGADRMITLTYRENMLDKARLERDFDALRRRLGKVCDFQYAAVAERQKRGAWHLHVAIRGRQNYRTLRSIWPGFSEHAMNEKRYWTGRDVVVPERMTIDHILSDDAADALKVAFAAAKRVGATLGRCQTFWHQEQGCFRLSIREL